MLFLRKKFELPNSSRGKDTPSGSPTNMHVLSVRNADINHFKRQLLKTFQTYGGEFGVQKVDFWKDGSLNFSNFLVCCGAC